MRKDTDIAIVGMSCIFPKANGIEEFWLNLVNGVDCITDVPQERIDHEYLQYKPGAVDRFYCKKGGFITVPVIDPARYGILPVAAEGYDSEHMASMVLAYEALDDAGVFEKNISLNKGSIILGKGNFAGISILRAIDVIHTTSQVMAVIKNLVPEIPDEDLEKFKKYYQESKGRYQADSAIGAMPNLIASLVANKLDMQGPAYTIDGACASSLIAIDHSIQYLLSGQCDIALAGGIHLGQSAIFWSIFNMLGAMSHKDMIAPLSEDADGLLIGEGAGMIVLKKLDKAIADNDRIYAVIKGSATCSDGAGVSVMAPNVKGQKLAIERAWANTGLDMNDVSYIEAHGTATVVGDRTEIYTMSEVFGNKPDAREIMIGSVKSNMGHIMPAAGIAGVIKTALSLYNRKFLPTLHCERPAKALLETRLRPVQKAMDWDESKFPLIAGVNAFGFGGVNGHVVMAAHEEEKASTTILTIPDLSQKERVIAVTAPKKEDLLRKIDDKNFSTDKDDPYRLIVFDPTPERIQKARDLVEKDKPWKGRLDIWFSNAPLLKEEGKLAFLFPGYEPDANPEYDSLIKYFGMERKLENIEDNKGLEFLLNLYHNSQFMDKALKNAGIKPDMNAGHSLGEWYAIRAAGLSDDESVQRFFNSIDTASSEPMEGMIFVAVGCGYDRIKDFCKDIPNLYLANDNCPDQILMCGNVETSDRLTEYLHNEKIYFQVLPYNSGYHTPFIADKMHYLDEAMEYITIHDKSDIPIWSATSLEQYPTDFEEFKALTLKHLTSTVRFRELIVKLYEQEHARVFIQVGQSGSLVGFVDDILKGKPYSAIATGSPTRKGFEQLRRVLALLFIEGRKVDHKILGIREEGKLKAPVRGIKPRMFIPVIKDLPMLREAAAKYRPTGTLSSLDSLFEDKNHPVLLAVNKNLQDAIKLQNEMVALFKERGYLDGALHIAPETPKKAEATPQQPPKATPKQAPTLEKDGYFEEDINISVKDYPYLYDHSIIHQPADWIYPEDHNPVIPMTMTLELLAETAAKHMPSDKKMIAIENAAVFKWMSVEVPFINKYVGKKKSENVVQINIDGHARGDIVFADSYPEVPEKYRGDIDLGKKIAEPPTREKIYDYYLFHGPSYHCAQEITEVSERGLKGIVKKAEGKGSLLDSMGQLLGVFTHLIVDKDKITFPIGLTRVTFYQDMHDQEGEFEYTFIMTELNDNFINGDVILKRDGKVWAIFENSQNRRFEFDQKVWDVVLRPKENILADEIKPGIYYFNDRYHHAASWDFLVKRYLNSPERKKHGSMMLNIRKYFVIRCVAAKDAVRNFLEKKDEEKEKYCYPIEVFINPDEKGRPVVSGPCKEDDVYVSIAHKKDESVAIASDKPVGIDIELIEERSPEFMDITFTDHEKELLSKLEPSEWSTRFWVAKEAFSKMKGTGLEGKPRQFEIEKIDGENLYIQGVKIETFKFKDKYIIGYIL